jgi:hypothetical protein
MKGNAGIGDNKVRVGSKHMLCNTHKNRGLYYTMVEA